MTPATILEHDGISQPITEWALDYGITPAIIIGRLERGMSALDAITIPMKISHRGQRLPIFSHEQTNTLAPKKAYVLKGESKTLTGWATHLGISRNTLRARLLRMTIAEAVAMGGKTRPGVVSDLPASQGTGVWGAAQTMPNITFSQEAAE